jgi:hypothetical protein
MIRIRVVITCIVTIFPGIMFFSTPSFAPEVSFRNRCEKVRSFPLPQGTSHIHIPVIVHLMKNMSPRFADNDIGRDFTTGELQNLFAPDGRMNTIWGQAAIRFVLHRIERCEYSSSDFEIVERENEMIESPLLDCQDRFWKISQAYNLRDVSGVDVYLWWDIVPATAGYAAPHRKDGTRRHGAIWVDRDCLNEDCGQVLAHEAGHFLGLCHTCRMTSAPSNSCRFRRCPTTRLPNCTRVPKKRLMRADWAGTDLTSDEIERARERALERIQDN